MCVRVHPMAFSLECKAFFNTEADATVFAAAGTGDSDFHGVIRAP